MLRAQTPGNEFKLAYCRGRFWRVPRVPATPHCARHLLSRRTGFESLAGHHSRNLNSNINHIRPITKVVRPAPRGYSGVSPTALILQIPSQSPHRPEGPPQFPALLGAAHAGSPAVRVYFRGRIPVSRRSRGSLEQNASREYHRRPAVVGAAGKRAAGALRPRRRAEDVCGGYLRV